MGDKLRLAVGIMGNAASLLLYSAPILTFKRVVERKSTEEFSCIPYIIALLNCLLYTWYGLPIVSYGWENFPVVTINGLGILLEFSFILAYLWFASAKGKASYLDFLLSAFVLHDHHLRKVFVGTVGVVASAAMYSSPLVAMKQVMHTKSVEFMPFSLSLFSFLASSLWLAYGLLGNDLFIASPNFVGSPLGILQLVLYCRYRKKGIAEEPAKWDLEQNDTKSTQLQLVVTEEIKEKN
ncbi:Bidirectional sugar transporter SWEET3b [Linum perenne]